MEINKTSYRVNVLFGKKGPPKRRAEKGGTKLSLYIKIPVIKIEHR
jgi:hypothetical protein